MWGGFMCIFPVWAICSRPHKRPTELGFGSGLNLSERKITARQFNRPCEEMAGLLLIAQPVQALSQTVCCTHVMMVDL